MEKQKCAVQFLAQICTGFAQDTVCKAVKQMQIKEFALSLSLENSGFRYGKNAIDKPFPACYNKMALKEKMCARSSDGRATDF